MTITEKMINYVYSNGWRANTIIFQIEKYVFGKHSVYWMFQFRRRFIEKTSHTQIQFDRKRFEKWFFFSAPSYFDVEFLRHPNLLNCFLNVIFAFETKFGMNKKHVHKHWMYQVQDHASHQQIDIDIQTHMRKKNTNSSNNNNEKVIRHIIFTLNVYFCWQN